MIRVLYFLAIICFLISPSYSLGGPLEEAQKLMCGDCEWTPVTHKIKMQEARQIAMKIGALPKAKEWKAFEARREGKLDSVAWLAQSKVHREDTTALIWIGMDGQHRGIEILTFNEPKEYRPPPDWLNGVKGEAGVDFNRLKKKLGNISGATISANTFLSLATQAGVLQSLKYPKGNARP